MGKIDWSDEEYPKSHDFSKEPVLEGIVTGFDTVKLKDRDADLMTVKPDDGEIVTVWLGAVLRSQVEKRGPKVGDYVGIKYLGDVKGGGAQPYKNYEMRVIPVVDDLGE